MTLADGRGLKLAGMAGHAYEWRGEAARQYMWRHWYGWRAFMKYSASRRAADSY